MTGRVRQANQDAVSGAAGAIMAPFVARASE